MPSGPGTYGRKRGRPPKKKTPAQKNTKSLAKKAQNVMTGKGNAKKRTRRKVGKAPKRNPVSNLGSFTKSAGRVATKAASVAKRGFKSGAGKAFRLAPVGLGLTLGGIAVNQASKLSAPGRKAMQQKPFTQTPKGSVLTSSLQQKPKKKPTRTQPQSKPKTKSPVVRTTKTKGGNFPTYRKNSKQAANFRQAFAAARRSKKKTFTFEGRKYNTKVK